MRLCLVGSVVTVLNSVQCTMYCTCVACVAWACVIRLQWQCVSGWAGEWLALVLCVGAHGMIRLHKQCSQSHSLWLLACTKH